MSRIPHLRTLISALPPTPLRPAGTPQLSNALEAIIERVQKSSSLSAERKEEGIERMIGSLERLRDGSASRRYQLSPRTLQPIHDPQYYKRITDGVQRAARGQGRSWWKSFFQIKGDA